MKWLLILLLSVGLAHARSVVFIGDSLTEGYGLETEEAFPAQLEKLLHSQGKTDIKVINGGVSGSTTANAPQRVKWYLKSKPDLIVLALGANDGLRGLSPAESRKNLAEAIRLIREAKVKVLLAGMKMPTNYGEAYRKEFEKTYADLAAQNKIPVLNFMLEGVGGVPKLNQADGIHPNAEGHKKIAQNFLSALGPQL